MAKQNYDDGPEWNTGDSKSGSESGNIEQMQAGIQEKQALAEQMNASENITRQQATQQASLESLKQMKGQGSDDVDLAGDLSSANKQLKSIFDKVKLTENRDFVGMDEKGYKNFVQVINGYMNDVNSIINEFQFSGGDNPVVLKGSAESVMVTFTKAFQDLLNRYVNKLKIDKNEAKKAVEVYSEKAKGISENVEANIKRMKSIDLG